MHQYKGVIFDLDGTLVDSLEDLIDSLNEIMRYHDFPTHSYEAGKKFVGRGIRNMTKMAIPKGCHNDDFFIDKLTDMVRAAYMENYTKKTKPYPGINKLLDYLTYHKIPFGVVTNKPDPMAKSLVKIIFKEYDFVDVIGDTEPELRKPNPQTTLALAKKMAIKPSECLFVGDSLVDYETAKNAEMLGVLCTWGFEDRDVIMAIEDTLWIHNPIRIVDALRYGTEMYSVFNEDAKKEPEEKKKSYWEKKGL